VQQRGEFLRTQPRYYDYWRIVISALLTRIVQVEQEVRILSCYVTISIP
jgi:hypothetical protein